MEEQSQIEIYRTEDGTNQIEVALREETIWLTQAQIAKLFETTPQNITMHLQNVFIEQELDEKATCKEFLQVQKEGNRNVKRARLHYNLDAIISVGYRVTSARATQFRIWANKVLKDYLVKGFAVNEKRLKESNAKLEELKKLVQIQDQVASDYALESNESAGLIKIISSYANALELLDDYDHQRLEIGGESKEAQKIGYKDARAAIDELGKQTKFEGLFGREKDDSFKGSLENIFQTFDGKDLYPSIEEKAAHLLYFVVKNHSFSDGNKRIAAFLFVWFMDLNGILFDVDENKTIADETLVALTLMIAESDPRDKDMMIKVIVNLIV